MKHSFIWIGVMAAASGAALAVACSSSTDSTGTPAAKDSGIPDPGSSGAAQPPTTGVVPDKDTCIAAGNDNTCQCSCGITGQTENKSLHCKQPAQSTGECAKVCCSGPITPGSSGTSGTSGTSGSLDASTD